MDRDYFRLESAARKTGRTEEDLLYLIESGKLNASLYAKKRQFCVLAKSKDTGLTHYIGTTFYRGLVLISKEDQLNLIENGNAVVKIFIPNEKIKTDSINRVNPFKKTLGPCGLYSWKFLDDEDVEGSTLYLHTLPVEAVSSASIIYKATQLLADYARNSVSNTDDNNLNIETLPDLDFINVYTFDKNGKFNTDEISILERDLRIAKLLPVEKSLGDLSTTNSSEVLKWCDSKARHTNIDRVLERAYLSNPKSSTKSIWKDIDSKFKAMDNSLDVELIVEVMDDVCIEWYTKQGVAKPLSSKSFENKISMIRKFYKVS